jgi:hypothetical protein
VNVVHLDFHHPSACAQMSLPTPANGVSAASIFQSYVKLCEATQTHVRSAHDHVKNRTYETQQTKEGRQEMKLRMFIIMQVGYALGSGNAPGSTATTCIVDVPPLVANIIPDPANLCQDMHLINRMAVEFHLAMNKMSSSSWHIRSAAKSLLYIYSFSHLLYIDSFSHLPTSMHAPRHTHASASRKHEQQPAA